MKPERPDIVTASEIADFVYCPEAWRLRHIGTPTANQPQQDAGVIHHAEKATAERVAGGSIALGRWLILAALIALAVLWWLGR